jgi:DNA-binding NarL/FixJ family response regulator
MMKDSKHINVLSVDDHPLIREGIGTVIRSQPDMSIVAEAATGRGAMEVFRQHRPDVTLMDLRLPDMSGVDAMAAILAEFPEARIIILTTFSGDVEMKRALAAGARGYMLKSMDPGELVQMVRQVHGGRKGISPEVAEQLAEHMGEETLTPREIGVLELAAGGNGNREIAAKLLISEDTVKGHIRHIMEKLNAKDRTQAVSIALRRGIMHL